MMREKPAIEGGVPVRKKFLLFHRPSLGREEEKRVLEVLRSGWLTKGKLTKEFEEEFAKFVNAKYAVGLNSATAGLHLSLVAIGVSYKDEVIVPSIGFASDANVVVNVGAKPVFCDVEEETLNISPEEIEKKITKRTKAIIAIHLYGYPCKIDIIKSIAKKYNIAVIEDAAHALGASYKKKMIGSISEFNAFSFYATKNITTGEGGMFTTNNSSIAKKIEILSLHGLNRDAYKRYAEKTYKHWNIFYPGYKYNMFDIQAALGLEQLKKLKKFLERRKEIVLRYNEAFSKIPQIRLLTENTEEDVFSAYHLYPIIVKTEQLRVNRDRILLALQAENIGVSVHFRALHLQSFYRKSFGYKRGDFPTAEYASDRLISLPLFVDMSQQDINDVIRAVFKVINYYKK